MNSNANFKLKLAVHLAKHAKDFLPKGILSGVAGVSMAPIIPIASYLVGSAAVVHSFKVATAVSSALSDINFHKLFAEEKKETFSEMLMRLVGESGKKNSVIYNRANINRQTFYKIKKNVNYQPSFDTAISFAFGLRLDLEKTNSLLNSAGYSLKSSLRDHIIKYFIEHKKYNLVLLNDCLADYKQPSLLGREKKDL